MAIPSHPPVPNPGQRVPRGTSNPTSNSPNYLPNYPQKLSHTLLDVSPEFSSLDEEIRGLMRLAGGKMTYEQCQDFINKRYEAGYEDGKAGSSPSLPALLSYSLGYKDGKADRQLLP